MPSLSPGDELASSFESILPGAPTAGHQTLTTLVFRWKRYIIYLSNRQLNILRSPTELIQAITFEQKLVAVRAEVEDNGRFAVATADGVWILRPETSATNRVTWTRELYLKAYQKEQARTLCWGAEGELLVGYESVLAGYNTAPASRASSPLEKPSGADTWDERALYWTKWTASPVSFAEFSPDNDYIATTGARDRIVKIWRRLSYEDAIFDYAYLPHDTAVTHVEWRPRDAESLTSDTISVRSYHVSDEHCDALYTLSTDSKMRIWRTNGHSDLDLLSLFATIDLVSAIPHSPVLPKKDSFARPARYAIILPSGQYNLAVEAALKKVRPDQVKHSIEHLKEVSSKKPDIIVTLDTQGRMSAWGLSSVGHKRRPTSSHDLAASPFHVAHSESIGMTFNVDTPAAFETWFDGDTLNIVALNFGESVVWWRGSVEDFSSSSAIETERGQQIARWQGSDANIESLCTAHDLKSMLAVSETGAVQQWSSSREVTLQRSTDFHTDVVSADVVQRGKSLLALTAEDAIMARVVDNKGQSSVKHNLSVKDPHWLRIDDSNGGSDETYIVYTNDGQYRILEVNPTRSDWQSKEPIVRIKESTDQSRLPLFSRLEDAESQLTQVHVLNHPRKLQWLRLIGLGPSGEVWRRDVSIQALSSSLQVVEDTLLFNSGAVPDISAATGDLVAIASNEAKKLIVVDLKQGYIEHEQEFAQKAMSVVFPATKTHEFSTTSQSILAIAYDYTVDVLARSRYNHHHHEQPHEWTMINRLSIDGIGFAIGAINWLHDGRLAIAAGNAMFISSNEITSKALSVDNRQRYELTADDDAAEVTQMAAMLNGPLSCWQPGMIRQLMLHNRFEAVLTILSSLEEKLRFYSEGDVLEPLLGLDVAVILEKGSPSAYFDEEILARLRDQLIDINLPYTSDADQERLKLIVAAVAYVLRHRQSLDSFALRYLFQWQYQVLLAEHQHQTDSTKNLPNGHNDSASSKPAPTMHWREIVFAYHSTTQQPLLEILVRHHENKLDWQTVRALGITLWLRTIKAAQSEGSTMASLEQIFDSLGQNAYRATFPPDPVQASLFLLALRKKAVLLSLWRVAVGNREQKTTQNFLKRDFSDEKNRVAARKNAYALMGKRRFEYAAAFFLLANDAASAISILAGQCEDLQLAIAVTRAFCGDGSPELKKLVHERIVPAARKQGDRWLMHWAYEASGETGDASKALIGDFKDLFGEEDVLPLRNWQQDDPTTIVLYYELRDLTGPDGKKKADSAVSVNEEYRAVLRSARVLRRLGFSLLALSMISRWTFVKVQDTTQQADANSNGTEETVKIAPSMLDAFNEPAVKSSSTEGAANSMLDALQDINTSSAAPVSDADDRAAKAAALLAKMRAKKTGSSDASSKSSGQKAKEEPTQFNEPAASSILDSFGF